MLDGGVANVHARGSCGSGAARIAASWANAYWIVRALGMSETFETAATQIVQAGRRLDARGWAMAGAGNYSVRLADGSFAITASGRHKGRLQPSDVMRVDAAGASLDGRKPSAETLLHGAVYRCRPEAEAVLHTHSVHGVTLSRATRGDVIVLRGYEMAKALPGFATHEDDVVVPVFDNDQDMEHLAPRVDAALNAEPRTPLFMLRGHGLYAWAGSMEQAICAIEGAEHMLACELEHLRTGTGVAT